MKIIILIVFLIISIILVYIKIHFEYYHFLFPLILIYALWWFGLRNERSPGRKVLVSLLLILNICILFLSDSYLYKKINSDKYYWTEQKLKVNHFKGKPDSALRETAVVFPSIVGKISRVFNYPPAIILTADHNNKSWIKKELFMNTNEDLKILSWILNHEKKHLDITEIYSRKAIDSINNLILPSYKLKYDIVEYYYNVSDSINDLFDNETEHSANRNSQRKWDNYIESELNLE